MSEWWIDEDGNALEADGDVGDMNHEMYVVDRVSRELVGFLGYEPPDGPFALQDYYAKKVLKQAGIDPGFVDPITALRDVLMTMPEVRKAFGRGNAFADAFAVAIGSTKIDGREYAMKRWGWKRVAGIDIETWTFTREDMAIIVKGLDDIAGGELDDPGFVVNIEVGRKRYYQGITIESLEAGDPQAALVGARTNPGRRRQRTNNPPPRVRSNPRYPMVRRKSLSGLRIILDGAFVIIPSLSAWSGYLTFGAAAAVYRRLTTKRQAIRWACRVMGRPFTGSR